MQLMITDSGLGGLSVCAALAQRLQERSWKTPLRLIYLNAVPRDDQGYNAMPTHALKLATFNTVLESAQQRYAPHAILVACHSLSVLLPEIPFCQQTTPAVVGIVDTGLNLMQSAVKRQPEANILIFATDTTTQAGVYPRGLEALGVLPERIIAQACPGLATMISNDPEGSQVRERIRYFVQEALARQSLRTSHVYAFLGCTHYGYRQEFFAESLKAEGVPSVEILNPNESLAEYLFQALRPWETSGGSPQPISIEFLSRYALPSREVSTLAGFLRPLSHITAEAIENYTLDPSLFPYEAFSSFL